MYVSIDRKYNFDNPRNLNDFKNIFLYPRVATIKKQGADTGSDLIQIAYMLYLC